MKLREQVVVVTGGTAGVGRATIRAFAAKGARIGGLPPAETPINRRIEVRALDDVAAQVAHSSTLTFPGGEAIDASTRR